MLRLYLALFDFCQGLWNYLKNHDKHPYLGFTVPASFSLPGL